MNRKEQKLIECKQRFDHDKSLRQEYGIICGIDEAGRGPWIGPVYAAAVIFDDSAFIADLNDSKKLSEEKREYIYNEITEKAVAYSVAYAETEEINRLNILQATFLAMKRAVNALTVQPSLALIDGNRLPDIEIPSKTIVKGDSISASIAAASILAKVARDRYMKELGEKYPEFDFAANKGYGTAKHTDALIKYGFTPEHRQLFLRKLIKKTGGLKKYGE